MRGICVPTMCLQCRFNSEKLYRAVFKPAKHLVPHSCPREQRRRTPIPCRFTDRPTELLLLSLFVSRNARSHLLSKDLHPPRKRSHLDDSKPQRADGRATSSTGRHALRLAATSGPPAKTYALACSAIGDPHDRQVSRYPRLSGIPCTSQKLIPRVTSLCLTLLLAHSTVFG